MSSPQPKAPPKKEPPTKPTKRAGMGQNPKYLRAYRVRTGRQRTLPIPVCVLKEAITTGDQGPLLKHLGPELVAAVRESSND